MRRALIMISLIAVSTPAFAHKYWVRPNEFFFHNQTKMQDAQTSQRLTFDITGSDVYLNSDINREYQEPGSYNFDIVSPSGKHIDTENVHDLQTRTVGEAVLPEDGTYLLHWTRKADKPMYSSALKDEKTYLRKSKDELSRIERDQLKQTRATFQFSKTYITMLKTTPGFDKPVGDRLEIVPLQHPNNIIKGQSLSIKVLHDGKPFANAPVIALYDGYRAAKHGETPWKGKTDKNGIVKIRFDRPALWLIETEINVPASEPEKADEDRFKATLLLRVEEKKYVEPKPASH